MFKTCFDYIFLWMFTTDVIEDTGRCKQKAEFGVSLDT